MIQRALISVSNKEKILDFARALDSLNIEILTTGGTEEALKKAAIPCQAISEYTGFPEILGGRVKTLHPRIYGGILASSAEHRAEITSLQIKRIDMIIVTLYPFEEQARLQRSIPELMEYIDIGGVSLLRAGAKNFEHVVVVSDSEEYEQIILQLKSGQDFSYRQRFRYAQAAFAKVAGYDTAIHEHFKQQYAQSENIKKDR